MTKAAYARHRGCARSYVTKLAKGGRLPMVDGKVDQEAADAALGSPRPRARQVNRGRGNVAAPEAAERPEQPLALTPKGQPPDYAVSRAWREFYSAQKAKRELAELDGELLRRSDVVDTWTTGIVGVKNRIRGIPKRARLEIPGFTKTMVRPLLKMIDQVLQDLADAKLPKRRRRRATR